MRILVRTDDGRRSPVYLPDKATWKDLWDAIVKSFRGTPLSISVGFPSRPIYSDNPSTLLSSLCIRNGDTLTIRLETASAVTPTTHSKSHLTIRTMPDDNSCLFNAVAYVLCDKSRQDAGNLRRLAASLVLTDPFYTEAVLGMTAAKYALWISDPNHWGGGIELALFSTFFATEIASIDVATGRVDVFGEGKECLNRVYVLYSGIHYDALAMAKGGNAPESEDLTVFRSRDDSVLVEAVQIADLARAENRYTDLANFTLQCDVCGIALVGEREAQFHAMKTGHDRFSEYFRD